MGSGRAAAAGISPAAPLDDLLSRPQLSAGASAGPSDERGPGCTTSWVFTRPPQCNENRCFSPRASLSVFASTTPPRLRGLVLGVGQGLLQRFRHHRWLRACRDRVIKPRGMQAEGHGKPSCGTASHGALTDRRPTGGMPCAQGKCSTVCGLLEGAHKYNRHSSRKNVFLYISRCIVGFF